MVNNNSTNNGVMAGEINGSIVINQYRNVNIPSLIPKLIEALANFGDDEVDEILKVTNNDLKTYDIVNKIEYNSLIKYKHIIKEYSKYCNICEAAFNILDNNNFGAKSKILRSITGIYNDYKGELLLTYKEQELEEIQIIRKHADNIIAHTVQELQERINRGYQGEKIVREDIDYGLNIIICYSFIECKILEKPR